jgi:glyoxylate carboligase
MKLKNALVLQLSGRPGPVLIDLPDDIQRRELVI